MTAPDEFARPIERILSEQRRRWAAGDRVSVENLLAAHPGLAADDQDLLDLVYSEFCLRERQGERPTPEEYKQRFPQLAAVLDKQMEVHQAIGAGMAAPEQPAEDDPGRTAPHKDGKAARDPACAAERLATPLPPAVGRYQVQSVLGRGGFGIVYLAYDDQLERLVAIKVPHKTLVSRAEDAAAYLTEARIVAALDHPNIVPVHDVGSSDDCPCFVVSKYIEGSTLARRIKEDPLPVPAATALVATVAEALHYTHQEGLVHRDVKPGNILLDTSGKPYVADFGLALREQELGKGPRYAGTPAYMSPEQARGEGHRVDGRSDLFSLGVVFYEMLTGHRPFRADTQNELREQITTMEVRPLRQWDDAIPKELERICQKALCKRAANRYPTARDMADDLRHYLRVAGDGWRVAGESETPGSSPATHHPPPTTPTTPTSDRLPLKKIVPKGLRSFDGEDADFFLELLPGPRDREGLPDSLRFWKTRIEEKDADNTFAVGQIYGPSGCGKSSLMKAGLLPRLSRDVVSVYVEATADDTETRLLTGLRKHCPGLAADLETVGSARVPPAAPRPEEPGHSKLKDTLAFLRRGQGVPAAKKVLIILDQFEQWLHSGKEANAELVQALRQCDGGRVQCILMVRDDFWMGVTRFLSQLEIDLVQGRNCAAADLFDLDHARKVLAAYGRAFSKLPEQAKEMKKEQKEFLSQAVSGLSQEGKVICVRLSLFAEMMKNKPWTAATLKQVGGTEGIGVTFLEDAFSARAANPRYRLHQKAARAVLNALLPESGSDIKGTMRSRAELLTASGYTGNPRHFDDLLRILDNEIRLITPTDPEGNEKGEPGGVSPPRETNHYYQLTHDYLVPSLRSWLTLKQKETRRGRAELLLADQAADWKARRENRHLPSLVRWLQIRLLTRKRSWTPEQQRMMRKASHYHVARGTVVGMLVMVVIALTGLVIHYQTVQQNQAHAAGLVRQVLDADIGKVPALIQEMTDYRQWTDPLLHEASAEAAAAQRQDIPRAEKDRQAARQLRASLALVPMDAGQVEYLYGRFLDAAPNEARVILDLGIKHGDQGLTVLQAEVDQKASANDKLNAYVTILLQDQPLAAVSCSSYFLTIPMETLAKRQANAAVALLRLHHPEKVWPLLKHSPDPRARSYLVERLAPLGADPNDIVKRLDEEQDVTIRRALVLALGEFEDSQLPSSRRLPLIDKVMHIYEQDKDAGLHGAAEWLLRQWGQEARLKAAIKNARGGGGRQWYVNGQGQTMVSIPGPVEFVMGSPLSEDGRHPGEPQHHKRIGRSFAISATPVTKEQFQRFFPLSNNNGMELYPKPTCPIGGVYWTDAAKYCNWLSKQEGIPENQWCYATSKTGAVAKTRPNFLMLLGYRLPTEAEWEYACRAGAVTSRSYGESEELLGKYAWYVRNAENRTYPVGRKKPNDFGLFDMHGNVSNWCQDEYHEYPRDREKIFEDTGDKSNVVGLQSRVLRGGRFSYPARDVRCADRSASSPSILLNYAGFRPARTLANK